MLSVVCTISKKKNHITNGNIVQGANITPLSQLAFYLLHTHWLLAYVPSSGYLTMSSGIYIWNGFFGNYIHVCRLYYLWISFCDNVKSTLQYFCYKRVDRMDHCSHFFLLSHNGIAHHYILPCDFVVLLSRVGGEYLCASLIWGLDMKFSLSSDTWREMEMCQSWTLSAKGIIMVSLILLFFWHFL